MLKRLSPLVATLLSLTLSFPIPSWAGNKPTLIVPPIGSGANEQARIALVQALKDTGVVTVVDVANVNQYIQSKTNSAPQTKQSKGNGGAATKLKKGIAAYKELKFKESQQLFEDSKRLFQDSLMENNSFEGLRASQFFLARNYLAQKDVAQAKEELTQAVLRDPERENRKLSEKLYSPDLRKLYDEARKNVASREHGDLEIKSKPPGAVIYLDGKSLGMAPVTASNIPVGEHYLRATLEGREVYFSPKVIISGLNSVEIELKPLLQIDPEQTFSTVLQASDLEHQRVAFLDQMGLSLGADIFVLINAQQGAVRAQFYDQRSQEVSAVEVASTPEELARKLVHHLGDDGYVLPPKKEEVPSVLARPTEQGLPENLQPQEESRFSQPAEQVPSEAMLPARGPAWYENHWVWISVGAGVALLVGGVFLFAKKSSAPTSVLTVQVPGK